MFNNCCCGCGLRRLSVSKYKYGYCGFGSAALNPRRWRTISVVVDRTHTGSPTDGAVVADYQATFTISYNRFNGKPTVTVSRNIYSTDPDGWVTMDAVEYALREIGVDLWRLSPWNFTLTGFTNAERHTVTPYSGTVITEDFTVNLSDEYTEAELEHDLLELFNTPHLGGLSGLDGILDGQNWEVYYNSCPHSQDIRATSLIPDIPTGWPDPVVEFDLNPSGMGTNCRPVKYPAFQSERIASAATITATRFYRSAPLCVKTETNTVDYPAGSEVRTSETACEMVTATPDVAGREKVDVFYPPRNNWFTGGDSNTIYHVYADGYATDGVITNPGANCFCAPNLWP